MTTVHGNELIDKAAAEAFTQLSKTSDRFERYDNAHASRIATIADEIAKLFHLARHDRGSLRVACLLHDLGEVAMERDYIQRNGLLPAALGVYARRTTSRWNHCCRTAAASGPSYDAPSSSIAGRVGC